MKFYTAEKFTIIHTVFSKFQRIDPIQGEAWAIAIGQYNSDGTLRFPEDGEEICSKHFVNGNHEQYISSPSYAPTLSMPENSVTKIDNSMYTFELTKKCIIDDCTNIRGENPEIKFYKAKVCKNFVKVIGY